MAFYLFATTVFYGIALAQEFEALDVVSLMVDRHTINSIKEGQCVLLGANLLSFTKLSTFFLREHLR